MGRIRAAFLDPDGERYGIPTYWWKGAPPGYATRRQLRKRGLRPAGQPVAAQILWAGVGGTRVAYLYRIDLAAPKRPATAAQLRAVDAALLARRTCPICRCVRPYYIARSHGECLICHDGGGSMTTLAPAYPAELIEQCVTRFTAGLHTADDLTVDHEADRLESLPTSPVVTRMRAIVADELATRRGHLGTTRRVSPAAADASRTPANPTASALGVAA